MKTIVITNVSILPESHGHFRVTVNGYEEATMNSVEYYSVTNNSRLIDRMRDDDQDKELAAKEQAIVMVLEDNDVDITSIKEEWTQRSGYHWIVTVREGDK